ncbi:hypothetical protein HZF05_09160 [Sphingomonas sp. CGMCC 1.13654]|uniref:DUF2306 domain-containing protein n=1 Tax=Sphingomonas chungangi TaxID=2683589 RepID=A0A838L5G5_9SPHN|nr:hypothetical protein [Sphingomonas chungangi]MBA2934267.1 hypothetical protein [Sphingomonas chungangi]MVW57308.1 hypothetical protein [Sphingomonas chungangi]
MATVAWARTRADRLFYSGVAIVVACFVLVGFGPSWFARPMLGAPAGIGPLSWVLILHGTLMTAWLALTVGQPLLVAANNRALHRSLGMAGATVAALILLVVPLATIHSMRNGGVPAFPTIYVFFAVNIVGLIAFAAAVGLGIARRRDAEAHKRLMTLSLVVLMPPAIGRWPVLYVLMPISGFLLADAIILAGCLYDWQTRGRVHRVWKVGGPLMIASQLICGPLGFSAPWIAFGRWAMRLPV